MYAWACLLLISHLSHSWQNRLRSLRSVDDIVAALLAETLERGADAASVLTEPVGSPTLAGFSEVDALHSAPDLPATSGQGLGGLLALASGGAGDRPLVMVSAETERYPGQLPNESPAEWGARAGGVFKEVLRRIELGVTHLDGRFEYSVGLFSPSSPIKLLSSYLRSASGLRETKGRAGLVSVLTRAVYPRLFTSDREVLRTLPKNRPTQNPHSLAMERADSPAASGHPRSRAVLGPDGWSPKAGDPYAGAARRAAAHRPAAAREGALLGDCARACSWPCTAGGHSCRRAAGVRRRLAGSKPSPHRHHVAR